MSVNISGLDRDELLKNLWENSNVAGLFEGRSDTVWDLEAAKSQLCNGYADYIQGRVMKVNIYNTDNVDPWGYNRDNGHNAFQNVVNKMRGN